MTHSSIIEKQNILTQFGTFRPVVRSLVTLLKTFYEATASLGNGHGYQYCR